MGGARAVGVCVCVCARARVRVPACGPGVSYFLSFRPLPIFPSFFGGRRDGDLLSSRLRAEQIRAGVYVRVVQAFPTSCLPFCLSFVSPR